MRLPLPLLPKWMRWCGALAVMAFVLYFSVFALPPADATAVPGNPELVPLDKWRHFLAYGAIAGSLVYATVDVDRPMRQRVLFVVGVTILFGVGIEVWQSMIPNRYFGLGDAYANGIGALLVTPWYLLRSSIECRPILTRLSVS